MSADTPDLNATDVFRELAKISDQRLPEVEALAEVPRPAGESPLIAACIDIAVVKERAFNAALHQAADSGEFDEVVEPA